MSDLDPAVRQDETTFDDAAPSDVASIETVQQASVQQASVPNEAVQHDTSSSETVPAVDLDEIERDLRDVETSLARLADGTYFAQPVASVPGTNATGSTESGTASAAGLGA